MTSHQVFWQMIVVKGPFSYKCLFSKALGLVVGGREVLARLQPSLRVVLMAPGGQGKFGNTNKLTNLRLYKILSIFY